MKKISFAAAALGVTLFMQGCFFESDCYDETYERCETRCDAFYCWDECETIEVCTSDSYGYTECVRNADCGYGNVCNNGQCQKIPTNNLHTVPMCGSCTDSQQCSEASAACTLINTQTREQVCTRSCIQNSDCPSNFVCESVGASTYQCIPKSLSCSNSSQWCENNSGCYAGEICQNNLCVRGQSAGCQTNQECGNPQQFVCKDGQCTRYCFDDLECPAGEACFYTSGQFYSSGVCLDSSHVQCRYSADCFDRSFICSNGRCEKSCTSTADCANSYTDNYLCLGGYCQMKY